MLVRVIALCAITVAPLPYAQPATAQQTRDALTPPARTIPVDEASLAAKLNSNTVTIVSGNPNGTYLAVAYDISAVLDDGDNLRILPIVGKGATQNVRDVLYLKGVDMGITQTSVIRYFNKTGQAGRNIEQKLRYVAPLFNEELHILARADINTIEDLRGKKVNFSDAGSGTQMTSRLLFEDLGIKVEEVNMGQLDAIEKLKAGEIAASMLVAGKPAGAYGKLPTGSGLKFLPLTFDRFVEKDYLPAQLTAADYPNLIAADSAVDTVAFSSVLAVFNWAATTDRYRRVELFTNAFFKNFDKFLTKPRHPKWQEVNLLADVPGWTRFEPAQRLVDAERDSRSTGAMKTAFDRFLSEAGTAGASVALTPEKRGELFKKFMDWQKAQPPIR